MWQSLVFATADRGSGRAEELKVDKPIPPRSYVIRIYIDRDDLTKQDRDYKLGDKEFFGRVSFVGNGIQATKNPRWCTLPQKTKQTKRIDR